MLIFVIHLWGNYLIKNVKVLKKSIMSNNIVENIVLQKKKIVHASKSFSKDKFIKICVINVIEMSWKKITFLNILKFKYCLKNRRNSK